MFYLKHIWVHDGNWKKQKKNKSKQEQVSRRLIHLFSSSSLDTIGDMKVDFSSFLMSLKSLECITYWYSRMSLWMLEEDWWRSLLACCCLDLCGACHTLNLDPTFFRFDLFFLLVSTFFFCLWVWVCGLVQT